MSIKKSFQVLSVVVSIGLSAQSAAFTPNIQAALFNAAIYDTSIIKQQRLIRYTDILYRSLNGEETTSLLGHQQLKIASYMYLAEFWQNYSLAKILYERGVKIRDEDLEKLGVSPDTFKTKLSNVGPLNIAFNNPQCRTSTNAPFKVTYDEVYNAIVRLQGFLMAKGEPASEAALFYLKSYYYLRLHSPNSTYTYVNNQCISDVNGLLSCADKLTTNVNPNNLAVVKRYMAVDLKQMNLGKKEIEALAQCNLTMWHYIQSAGVLEPVNDGATVAASQALISQSSQSLKLKASSETDFKSILKDTKEIMSFLYYPDRYLTENTSHSDLAQPLMLNQIKMAALRLRHVIDRESVMNAEPNTESGVAFVHDK